MTVGRLPTAYTTVAFSELTANRSKDDHVKLAYSIWQKFDSQPEKMPVLLNLTVEPLDRAEQALRFPKASPGKAKVRPPSSKLQEIEAGGHWRRIQI